MSKNTKEQEIPYSYLVDNIKIFLIIIIQVMVRKTIKRQMEFIIIRKQLKMSIIK